MGLDAMVVGWDRVSGVLERYAREAPSVARLALNRTIARVYDAEVGQVRSVFDRPTPYTLRALKMRQATNSRLEAACGYKTEMDASNNGTSGAALMGPHVDGGPRGYKRAEYAMRSRYLLMPGEQLIPADAAPRDAYGNVSRAQIAKALANIRGGRDRYNDTPRGRKGKRAAAYFFGRVRGKLGIWMRTSRGHVVPFMLVTKVQQYRKRFDFAGVGTRIAEAALPEEIQRALRVLGEQG